MRPFAYDRAGDIAQASRLGRDTGQGQTSAHTQFLAGGTTLIDLMKLDVLRPAQVVDIHALEERHGAVEAGPEGLEILVFGAPNLGEDPRKDVEGQRDWWAD